MGTKIWYKSKTLWTNLIALLTVFGLELSGEEATAILAVINLILRLVTREKIVW